MRAWLVSVALGALGMLAVVAGLHVWQDHRDLHALLRLAAAAQQAKGAR